MSFIESRLLSNWRLWRLLALVFCSGLTAIGCGGGGGGDLDDSPRPCSQPSDPCYDPEGSTPDDAVVIVPDGAAFSGRINFGGDVDWFTFRAGVNINYTLQIFGFPKDPDPFNPDPSLFPEDDLTGPGELELQAQIVSFNGLDQIANSTGTEGGEQYDIFPAAFPEQTANVLADSRIVWLSPTTNDFFIRVEHGRPDSGTGHYVMHLASTQMGIADTGRVQYAARDITIIDPDEGCVLFSGFVSGYVGWTYWEDAEVRGYGTTSDVDDIWLYDGCPPEELNDDPEDSALHVHWGIPDILNPQNSNNFQTCDPDDPHCWAWDFQPPGSFPSDEVIRLIHGFEWYVDVHVTDNFELFAAPIAVSMPNPGVYRLFESEPLMSESNVILRDGSRVPESRQAGGPDFTLFYDSSLKAIQIARRTFNSGGLVGLWPADAESYQGDILNVYARGPGLDPPIPVIPPSVIPPPKEPLFFDELVLNYNSGESRPGFRNVVRQLADDEAEALRDAYYETGIYFEVTRWDTGQKVARIDLAPNDLSVRRLEIQQDPFPTVFFPDRASQGPLKKGTINFVSDYAEGGQITVVSNGKILGVLSDFLDEGLEPPECGETQAGQSLTAEYWPHSYPYKAVAEDGTEWKGHFEIRGDACETLVLSVE